MFGFNHFLQYQREAFRQWQETADEFGRQWLTSPVFLEYNSFLTKQNLDLYEFWLNYWSSVGFDKTAFHEAFKKFIAVSQTASKSLSANIELAQTAGFLPRTAQTPSEIVLENEHFRLLRYKSEKTNKTPILLVSSLVGKYYILDLTFGRSYVAFLLENGFDVFIVDWTTNDQSAKLSVEDYICRFLSQIVEKTCEISRANKISLLGYSLGGLLSLIFTALNGERVKNLLLLTTPVDFDEAAVLKKWTSEKYFDIDRVVNLFGNVSAATVSQSLQMVKPVSSFWRGFNLLQYADRREDFAALLALEIWLNDGAPFPAELFRTVIKELYRKNLLIKNKLKVGGQKVVLSKIKCPVLNVVGAHDQVAVPESSQKLLGLLGSVDKQTLALDYGHLTIVAGSGAQEDFWRRSVEWFAPRS